MATSHEEHGFNTVHNSNVEKRAKKRDLQRYTILAIICLVALTVFMLLVMAVGGIIANVSSGNKGPDKEKVDWGSFTVTTTDTYHGDLVLVNNTHEYTFPADDGHLEEIYAKWATHSPRTYVLSGLSKYMDKDALAALDSMLTDFAAVSGKDNVQVRYAYRTLEEQQSFSVPAGYSDHHTGLGCELKYSIKNGDNPVAYDLSTDPAYSWLTENCYKYGFVIRYPVDKADKTGIEDYNYYFRYVGVAHATYMTENNLCMEEYVELLKGYTHEKPLGINAADGNYYEVYYVAVDGSATVQHPTNYAYTVSGTNEGGVVITISRSQAIRPEESTGTGTTAG